MPHNLINFWKNVTFQAGTCIVQEDFDILKSHGLLISRQEYIRNSANTDAQILLHDSLPAEPFVGDLLNSSVYVIALNPGIGDDEYTNWQDAELNKMLQKNLQQQETDYPFYYLNPLLAHTGGAKYWGLPKGKFAKCIQELANYTGDLVSANKLIAQNVCDLEFCPYHSKKWGIKPEVVRLLPSVRALIDFVADYIIPDVIAGKKTLIVGRRVQEISKLMAGKHFDYNGRQITFDDLDALFPDNVVFYRTSGKATSMSFGPNTEAGQVLLKQLKTLC